MNFTTESLETLDARLDTLHDHILNLAEKLAKKQGVKVIDDTIMCQAYLQALKGK